MKRRFVMLAVIGAMVVITWQHGKNRALTQLLEKSKMQNVMHIDKVFDLQQENGALMEEIMLALRMTLPLSRQISRSLPG